jgi:hypothetical protein
MPAWEFTINDRRNQVRPKCSKAVRALAVWQKCTTSTKRQGQVRPFNGSALSKAARAPEGGGAQWQSGRL